MEVIRREQVADERSLVSPTCGSRTTLVRQQACLIRISREAGDEAAIICGDVGIRLRTVGCHA